MIFVLQQVLYCLHSQWLACSFFPLWAFWPTTGDYGLSSISNILVARSVLNRNVISITTAVVVSKTIVYFFEIGFYYRNHVMEMYKGKVTSIPRSETTSPATDCVGIVTRYIYIYLIYLDYYLLYVHKISHVCTDLSYVYIVMTVSDELYKVRRLSSCLPDLG